MSVDVKSHAAYVSKIVDEIIDTICSCPSTISSTTDILNHEGCISGDIVDTIGVIGYHAPTGKHICQLDSVQRNIDNDFFLVSQLEPSEEDSKTSRYISKKISYSNLRVQLIEDVINGLGLKSMAYEDKRNYVLTSHSHDEIYSRVEWTSNPQYGSLRTDKLSSLGQVLIDFETLSSCDVSSNPAMQEVSSTSASIYCPKNYIPPPPKPLIGTLKFVASPTIRHLLELNQLSTTSYSGIINVNPYDASGSIRVNYDGWVFPNGAIVSNINNQLSDAAQVFAGNANASEFTLPTIADFIQAYSQDGNLSGQLSAYPKQIGLKEHQHTVGRLKFSFTTASLDQRTRKIWTTRGNGGTNWIHHGKSGKEKVVNVDNVMVQFGSEALNKIKTNDAASDAQDPYPTHDLIPLMIYIGGETLEYYENQCEDHCT